MIKNILIFAGLLGSIYLVSYYFPRRSKEKFLQEFHENNIKHGYYVAYKEAPRIIDLGHPWRYRLTDLIWYCDREVFNHEQPLNKSVGIKQEEIKFIICNLEEKDYTYHISKYTMIFNKIHNNNKDTLFFDMVTNSNDKSEYIKCVSKLADYRSRNNWLTQDSFGIFIYHDENGGKVENIPSFSHPLRFVLENRY